MDKKDVGPIMLTPCQRVPSGGLLSFPSRRGFYGQRPYCALDSELTVAYSRLHFSLEGFSCEHFVSLFQIKAEDQGGYALCLWVHS